ncbi:MAG TPA: VOC family protein [Vicinamibacterales bacterium]|nr:VOC family protein [Vicinamibacterales bacterium]
MKLRTYVNFNGRCKEAFQYYEKHLHGRIVFLMTHGEMPGPSPLGPEWKDAVLHAQIAIGGTELMGADVPNAEPMRSAYLSINADSNEEAERLYKALGEGGRILMKMEETFFAFRFGQVQDRFGLNWMILHERPQ